MVATATIPAAVAQQLVLEILNAYVRKSALAG
jgi:hypothetical protein